MTENPWRDEETLLRLRDKGMTYKQMATELGCHRRTVARWMSKHDLNGFLGGEEVYIFMGTDGYVQCHDAEQTGSFYLHQLDAIANGADPFSVFGDEKMETHHIIDVPWLNFPENTISVPRGAHREMHDTSIALA